MNPLGRLLFLINDLPFFLSHRLPVAVAARKAGYDVHVAGPAGPDLSVLDTQGFTFHELPIHRSRSVLSEELRILMRIRTIYAALKPDLVHLITLKPVLYGGIVARFGRTVPMVFALTGLGHSFSSSGWVASARRWLMTRALKIALGHSMSKTILQNPDDLRELVAAGVVSPDRCALIRGSGVDLEVFAPAPEPEGVPLVLFASRMILEKGAGDFVEAARRLRKSGHGARFALVGNTDEANPSSIPAAVLEAWDKEGSVEWWRHRGDMPRVFAQSAVVCLPTYYREGVPKVLIEAAACGRPIVTTDWPGCREIVRHGQNGLLVPIRDVDALAEAIASLVRDPDRRRRMGERGREIAEKEFGVRAVVSSTLEVYKDALRLKGLPPAPPSPEVFRPSREKSSAAERTDRYARS